MLVIKSKNTWIKIIAILISVLCTRGIGMELIAAVDNAILKTESMASSEFYYQQLGAYYNEIYNALYETPDKVNHEALAAIREQNKFLFFVEQTGPRRNYSSLSNLKGSQELYPLSAVVVRVNSTNTDELAEYKYCKPLPPKNTEILIALTPQQYSALEAVFYNNINEAEKMTLINQFLYRLAAYTVALIASFGLLIYAATRKNAQQVVPMPFWNRPFLDISAVVTLAIISLCAFVCLMSFEELYDVNNDLMVFLIASCMLIALAFGLNWIVSLSRRIARKEFVRSTFIGWMFLQVARLCQHIGQRLSEGPFVQQTLLLYVGVLLGNLVLAFIVVGFISVSRLFILLIPAILFALGGFNLVALIFLLEKAAAIENIDKGTVAILEGDLSKPIPLKGGRRLAATAARLNELSQGFHNAINKELKSERMKTELLTNVSHDLKTPLTSIITSVDLLKREGLNSENAPHYLEIIDQKSQRLKSLTSDLFDAAKANTGNLQVDLAPLDFVALLHQGLGEMSSQIDNSTLIYKTEFPEKPFKVLADGKHLWRIIENLLSNTLKYTLDHTRVYLDIALTDTTAVLTIKNISATPLNLTPEALMERFVREDTSRTTEGSGLGLAIAKDLATLQGATLTLDIDGDLFKARLEIPLVN